MEPPIGTQVIEALRRSFYKLDAPWYRARLFEAFGCLRYSRPALHSLDVLLDERLDHDHGVFVEAGAHDGYTQSNTYFLERHRGWTGVLVEPVTAQYRKCERRRRRSRAFNCALVSEAYASDTITIHTGDLMSAVAGSQVGEAGAVAHAERGSGLVHRKSEKLQVPARTLSSVLDEAGVGTVDLLALDVEGFEMQALQGLDRSRHRPRLLLIEMLDVDAMQPEFDRFLAPDYEYVERLTGCDVLYRALAPI